MFLHQTGTGTTVINNNTNNPVPITPVTNNQPMQKIISQVFEYTIPNKKDYTTSIEIPANANVDVYRQGRLLRYGDNNDYVIKNSTIWLSDAIQNQSNPQDWIEVKYIEVENPVYEEQIDSPNVGSTQIIPKLNGGVVPQNSSQFELFRNGRLLNEGTNRDYTVALDSKITLTAPIATGESFILKLTK